MKFLARSGSLLLFWAMASFLTACSRADAPVVVLPVTVMPEDPNLRFAGRWTRAEDGVEQACAWPASAVSIRFSGTAVNALLELGYNRCQVVVDGQPGKVLSARVPGPQLYALASGLSDGEHTVMLFKRTEALIGPMALAGFQLNAGARVLPIPAPDRRIEVIGDSISAGFGNEAASAREPFSPATENAYLAYGAIAARAFGAEYTCIAWSGKCLWPDNTLPELYDRILPQQSTPLWNFAGPRPQVVLINLCTNDFGRGAPEEEGWVVAYRDFISRVRSHDPDAVIYLALGSMMTDDWSPSTKPLSTARAYIQRVAKECQAAGDANVRFIEFAPQEARNGFGANMHPSLKTHRLMAQTLIAAIHSDLGWPLVEKP